ncbi:MAG: hypothetical protein CBB68_02410 [Rhodospirillaceae bacterium TMED8]|nr:hypothetical protein [Magnetovibrio sp.]OUT52228.1 MAG: hypothetical protein CBB68_02410 [Rhodospirillaceae bacterium TMED8]|tara:strand:- start:262 stop:1740 length:1479 start_codon:yes stop_codon:yes gene_type:complete
MKTVVILGGGYTGTTAAINLSRLSPHPLTIIVVEPRKDVGAGVAYSSRHPDHRLNAPSSLHFVIPDERAALDDWFLQTVGLECDPEARAIDGSLFIRRSDFGDFVSAQFKRHAIENPSGSTLTHVRDSAIDVKQHGKSFLIKMVSGSILRADSILITTSNYKPSIPFPFTGKLETHPALVPNPWDVDSLEALPNNARGLIIGNGLTAADVVTLLKRKGHTGVVTALSRRGLQPTVRPRSHAGFEQHILDRVAARPSLFTKKHGRLRTVLEIFRAIRSDVKKAEASGLPWQSAFDDLRDSARDVWVHLPIEEKRRYMRHAGPYYDIHRYRFSPQTNEQLIAAKAQGWFKQQRGKLTAARSDCRRIIVEWQDETNGEAYRDTLDFVVICVGPETRPEKTSNPLLHSLIKRGIAKTSDLGVGLATDKFSRAIGHDSMPVNNAFVLGPLAFASFGYCLGVPFIMPQIRQAIPFILSDLGARTNICKRETDILINEF